MGHNSKKTCVYWWWLWIYQNNVIYIGQNGHKRAAEIGWHSYSFKREPSQKQKNKVTRHIWIKMEPKQKQDPQTSIWIKGGFKTETGFAHVINEKVKTKHLYRYMHQQWSQNRKRTHIFMNQGWSQSKNRTHMHIWWIKIGPKIETWSTYALITQTEST